MKVSTCRHLICQRPNRLNPTVVQNGKIAPRQTCRGFHDGWKLADQQTLNKLLGCTNKPLIQTYSGLKSFGEGVNRGHELLKNCDKQPWYDAEKYARLESVTTELAAKSLEIVKLMLEADDIFSDLAKRQKAENIRCSANMFL